MLGFFERRLDAFPDVREDGPPPTSLAAFIAHYAQGSWGWLALMALSAAAVAAGEVALFGFLGRIVDWLAEADRATFLEDHGATLLWMGALVLVALPLVTFFKSLVTFQTIMGNLPMRARWRMHGRMLDQSMAFFADEFAGRVATKVMQTALAVRDVLQDVLDVLVYVTVYFAAMTALVAASDLRLAAPLLFWLVVYVGLIAYFVPRLKNVSRAQADARSLMTGRIVDSYTNIATVKLFSHAGRERAYARDAMRGFLNTVHPQMRLVTWFYTFVDWNNAIVTALVAGLGVWFWMSDAVSLGALAAAIALTLRINGMSMWIMWEVSQLFENVGVVHDGMTMLTKAVAVRDAKDAKPLAVKEGAVRFESVCFHYGKEGGIIENFNLDIRPGEKLGLVGRSGAGKSTLVNLLLRLYDVERGDILIDGQSVSSVTQESLRAEIGVVSQDTALLHRSIRDNIAYGRPDASDAAVREAARRADALDFIDALVDAKGRRGLDAHVGERGVKLSGGQRQRIAIARIFLKNAPILVLDEATSALDSEVEAAIQKHLFALMEGKTVIAIAHRLSTIAAMDRLVVIDKGAIVEEGTHDELIAKGGLYADLWARQSGGFIASGAQEAA